jgi:Ca2+-binding RTX toxin-like protein
MGFIPNPPFWQYTQYGFPDPSTTPQQIVATAYTATDMDNLNLRGLLTGVANVLTDSTIVVDYGNGATDRFFGEFDYGARDLLTGGTLEHFQEYAASTLRFDVKGLDVPISTFFGWLGAGDTDTPFQAIFAGADRFTGSPFDDLLRTYGGNDTVLAGAGADSVFGGAGDDTISGGEGVGYLRGELGNDTIVGGSAFDDINGNEGNDVLNGGGGTDWVVGGKDSDLLRGDAGDDVVLGNLGADTLEGGTGNDVIRGGQDNDSLSGGDGDDWLSGDRGFDVLTGGTGADTFHFFAGAWVDRVLDFNPSQGDRVQIDPGTPYSVDQLGLDTIIRIGDVDQMVLVGVQLITLPPGWIFTA